MSKTLALLAVAALVALAASGTAGAAPAPAPYDAGPAGSAQRALQILPTASLPLGGVDLSQFGVASSELATVGPRGRARPRPTADADRRRRPRRLSERAVHVDSGGCECSASRER